MHQGIYDSGLVAIGMNLSTYITFIRLVIQRARVPVASRSGETISRTNFTPNFDTTKLSVSRWQMLGPTQMAHSFSSLFARRNGWMARTPYSARYGVLNRWIGTIAIQVIEGFNVVQKINQVPTYEKSGRPREEISIISISLKNT